MIVLPVFDYMSSEDIEMDYFKDFKRRLKYFDNVDKTNYRYEYINENLNIREYKVNTEEEIKEEQNRRLDNTWTKI